MRFGRGFGALEQGLADHEYLIVDARVADLYADPLRAALGGRSVLRLEATETAKSLEYLPRAALPLLERGIARGDVLVAVGGGIVQDIVCFLAATLLRGLAWRFYPTTLLAQADSCIGSKSSINVSGYKNMLGTYTPPADVWVAPEVLDTLAERDLRSGIGEIIKTQIIAGWDEVRALAADYPRLAGDRAVLVRYIRRALEIKQAIIEVDEFDRRERLVLNYGHTFGHALESATDYAIPHGIAVTIGMDLANYLSWQQGLLPQGVYDELHALLAMNYAGFERTPVPEDRFFGALARDKKKVAGALTLILTRGPGQVFVDRPADDAPFRERCRAFLARLLGAGVPAS